jgi:DNA polymerase elongation subunit (family B)
MRLKYPKTNPLNYISKIIMNSLYGRFGMKDSFEDLLILNQKDYKKFEKKFNQSIQDVIRLGSNFLIKIQKDEILNSLDNFTIHSNINIAIASAITAYARIHMSQFKNNPDFKLFYTDTDSIYINKKLPDSIISNTELGKLKLEFIASEAIFLAPKVYGLKLENGDCIIKIKGLTKEAILENKIGLTELEQLLIKNQSLEINQIKWFKKG